MQLESAEIHANLSGFLPPDVVQTIIERVDAYYARRSEAECNLFALWLASDKMSAAELLTKYQKKERGMRDARDQVF